MTDIDLKEAGHVQLIRPPDPPGKLAVLLTIIDGKIIMDFGRTVWWVGLTADEAEKLSRELSDAVRTARTLHTVT